MVAQSGLLIQAPAREGSRVGADPTPGQNLAPGLEVADPVPDPRNPVPGHVVAANQDLVPLTKSPGPAAGPDQGDPGLERIRSTDEKTR